MEDIDEDPVFDIDSCDAMNHLAVSEYVEDLYAYYRNMEVNSLLVIAPSIHMCCANYSIWYMF